MHLPLRHGITAAFGTCGLFAAAASAVSVPLNSNATATFSQPSFSVDNAANGVTPFNDAAGVGWAIADNRGTASDGTDDITASNTAVFETSSASGTGFAEGTRLTFTLVSGGYVSHTLGRFRLGVTTAAQNLYGDGDDNDATTTPSVDTVTWVTLDPISFSAVGQNADGTVNAGQTPTLTEQDGGAGETNDNSILVTGNNPDKATYTVVAETNLTGITGFRLDVIEDARLPADNTTASENGPGRSANGNIVLREFSVDAVAVPEPAAFSLIGLGGLLALRRRRA